MKALARYTRMRLLALLLALLPALLPGIGPGSAHAEEQCVQVALAWHEATSARGRDGEHPWGAPPGRLPRHEIAWHRIFLWR